jgi:hypothetical protein
MLPVESFTRTAHSAVAEQLNPSAGDADERSVDPCPTCASPRAADGWCPHCLTAPTNAGAGKPPPVNGLRRPVPPPSLETVVGSRFGADSTHFGLSGRLLCTVVLVAIPIALLWWGGFPYGLAFFVVWSFGILPRALRDLWSSSRRRVRVTSSR